MKKIYLSLISIILLAEKAMAAYGIPDEYKPNNIVETSESVETYSAETVIYLLGDLISGVLALVGVLAVYFLVSNALKYATSFGRQDEAEKAKKGIFWAIGGLLIILLSYIIVRFVIRIVLTTDEAAIDSAATSLLQTNLFG